LWILSEKKIHDLHLLIMKLAAIFILYYPEKEIISHIERIYSDIDYLFLYKNSEIPTSLLNAIHSKFDAKLIWLGNEQNNGIAKALNDGLFSAGKYGCEWLVTMDQDSYIDSDIFSELKTRAAKKTDRCILFSPDLLIRDRLFYQDNVKNYWIMTSCNFVRTSCVDLVGTFNEDYFIDGVDIEYCLRLQQKGFIFEIEKDLIGHHALGHRIEANLFGKKIFFTSHIPLRKYYIFRNYLDIVFKKKFLLRVRFKILYALFIRLYESLLFEPKKFQNLKMINMGFWHFLFSVKGKYSNG